MKVEAVGAKHPQLLYEAKLLKHLQVRKLEGRQNLAVVARAVGCLFAQ